MFSFQQTWICHLQDTSHYVKMSMWLTDTFHSYCRTFHESFSVVSVGTLVGGHWPGSSGRRNVCAASGNTLPWCQVRTLNILNRPLQRCRMSVMELHITSNSTVSAVASGLYQRKHSFILLALCWGNSPVTNRFFSNKAPIIWKVFPWHDVIVLSLFNKGSEAKIG